MGKDKQVSMEVGGNGVLTTQFLETIKGRRGDDVPLHEFITRIQDQCSMWRQVPMLSCSHDIDLGQPLSKMIDGDFENQMGSNSGGNKKATLPPRRSNYSYRQRSEGNRHPTGLKSEPMR